MEEGLEGFTRGSSFDLEGFHKGQMERRFYHVHPIYEFFPNLNNIQTSIMTQMSNCNQEISLNYLY